MEIVSLLAISVLLTAFFIWNETRAEDPIIPLGLFRYRTFTTSVVTMFFLGAGMFGAIMFIPHFMQTVARRRSGALGHPGNRSSNHQSLNSRVVEQ